MWVDREYYDPANTHSRSRSVFSERMSMMILYHSNNTAFCSPKQTDSTTPRAIHTVLQKWVASD